MGTTHRLYTRSHLQYGSNAVEQRIAQMAFDDWTEDGNPDIGVYNPCLNTNYSGTYNVTNGTGDVVQVVQYGDSTTDVHGCKAMMKELLANDTTCYVHDCSFNGVYLADIPSDMTFVAFSGFVYAVTDLGMNSTTDLGPIYETAVKICNMTWEELRTSEYNNSHTQKYLSTYCRTMNYVYVLLHFGYGFPDTNTPIIFASKHKDISITWTQGSILRDANWLPYEVDFVTDDDLKSQVEAWRAVGITAGVFAVLGVGATIYLLMKMKK